MLLETCRLSEVSLLDRRRLLELTLTGAEKNEDSAMQVRLERSCPAVKRRTRVVLARAEDTIIGWACASRVMLGSTLAHRHARPIIDINIYVCPKRRRQKVGSALLLQLKAVADQAWPGVDIQAWPHDETSRLFFERALVGYTPPTPEELAWAMGDGPESPGTQVQEGA